MKPKSMGVLAAVVAASVAAAFIARGGRERAGAGAAEVGEPLFPALTGRVNDVAGLKVVKGAETFEIARGDKGWGLASRGGYPVEIENVKKTILGVAKLEIVEEKTSKPERYGEIGVEEPSGEGSDSILLTLLDKSGSPMASLIVGDSALGGAKPTVYVRRAGEAKSFRCKGELAIDTTPTRWIKADVLKIDRERTRSVEVMHPDGEVVAIDKAAPEDADFAVQNVPEGREVLAASAAGTLGTALTWLNIDDVKPAAEVDFSAAPGPKSVFECFDGLVVTVETTDVDGKTWARFAARFETPPPVPDAAASPADAPASSPDAPAAADPDASGEAKPADAPAAPPAAPAVAAPATPKLKSPEDVQKEVADLNARLEGWAFQIPSYKATTFKKRLEEFLKPLPAPETPAVDPAAPSDGGGDAADGAPVPPATPAPGGGDRQ